MQNKIARFFVSFGRKTLNTNIIMSEETNNTQFDPRDRNQDGKVSLEEKVRYAAEKAGDAISGAAKAVKDYAKGTPEDRKAKNEEIKGKISAAADKVEDAAKKVYGEVKEGAEKLFKKEEEPKAEAEPEKPAE